MQGGDGDGDTEGVPLAHLAGRTDALSKSEATTF